MKILVVNDDSIHAPGIVLLAKAAMELGEVTVVAPANQCSAMSQRITIRGDMRVDKVQDFPVPVKAAYKVDGTPADCLKIAMQYLLEEKPDYVFSGINDGYNAGFDIAYSGTLGAAFEAVTFPETVCLSGFCPVSTFVCVSIYFTRMSFFLTNPVGNRKYCFIFRDRLKKIRISWLSRGRYWSSTITRAY